MKPQTVAAIASVIFSTITVAQAAVDISAKPTANMTCSAGVCSPTAKRAVLNVGDLEAMLSSGDVRVTSGSQAQDIELDKTLRWSSSQTLTLDAYRSLFIAKPLLVNGLGSLAINTNDGGSGGDYQFLGTGHVEFRQSDPDVTALHINGVPFTLVANTSQLHDATFFNVVNIALAQSFINHKVFTASFVATRSQGTIEGLGNTISNFEMHVRRVRSDGGFGFIGELAWGASVRDLTLSNVNVSFGVSFNPDKRRFIIGSLVGTLSGTVKYAHVKGGSVTAAGVTGQDIYLGGLIGVDSGYIIGSSSSASVSGSSVVRAVGGLIGVHEGSTAGHTSGFMDQSYATGLVSGGDGVMTGNLVGENLGGSITNSYSQGNVVSGSNAFVGGLIGANLDNSIEGAHPVVQASYSTGSVTGGSGTQLGGLMGEDTAPPAIATTYWDLDTSGIGDPGKGAGNIANDPGITGLTDVQLKSALPVGFDRKVWAQKASINNGLPYLIANTPPK